LVEPVTNDYYSSTMSMVDASSFETTLYYKIQIIKHKTNPVWHVFRSWGKLGTEKGSKLKYFHIFLIFICRILSNLIIDSDKKLKEYSNQNEAIKIFKDIYHQKTGNHWIDRKTAKKQPKKWCALEIEKFYEDPHVKFLAKKYIFILI